MLVEVISKVELRKTAMKKEKRINEIFYIRFKK